MSQRVVVIGAGIAGSYAAYFLALRGVCATILDPSGIGTHASARNPGGLNPLHGAGIPGPLASFAMESFRLHTDSWEGIARRSSVDFSPRLVSRLHLDPTEEQVRTLLELYGGAHGFKAEVLEGKALHKMQPGLHEDLRAGLLASGNATVDPGPYVHAVCEAAREMGASFRQARVTGLGRQGPRVTSVQIEDEAIPCDAAVLATGPWSDVLAEGLGFRVPVEPVKGELLLAEAPDPTVAFDLSFERAEVYQRGDGRVLLGWTEERSGFDETPSEGGRRTILDGVARILPGFRPRILRHFAGLRPMTPDGMPIVGKAPGFENLFLATGGGRKGMLLSAAMGTALADLVTQGRTSLPIDALGLERFASLGTLR